MSGFEVFTKSLAGQAVSVEHRTHALFRLTPKLQHSSFDLRQYVSTDEAERPALAQPAAMRR